MDRKHLGQGKSNEGIKTKERKFSATLVCALLCAVSFIPMISLIPNSVSAGILSDHAYVVNIPVTGTTGGVQTNYQMKLTVNNGTGSNSAGTIYLNNHALNWPYDIRFTKSDMATGLDFWRESYDANTMTVWVELDSIPASPASANFYAHYGMSAEADASNGTNTFPFFDDFLGTSFDAQWGSVQTATVSGGQAHLTVGTDDTTTESYIMSTATFGLNKSFEIQFTPATSTTARPGMAAQRTTFGSGAINLVGAQFLHTGNLYTNTNDGSGTPLQTLIGPFTETSQIFTIQWTANKAVWLKDRTSVWDTQTTQVPSGTDLKMYLRDIMDVDWILLRNYQLVEPTWGSPSVETSSNLPAISSSPNVVDSVGLAYFYNATCTYVGATGAINWQLQTNATWLTQGLNGTGFQNIGGTPIAVGIFYVNLTVNDSDSSDYQNYSITVAGYGVNIPVIGTADGAQTNYQMKLTVNEGIGTNSAGTIYLNNHALNWPYDIRFSNSDQTTALDFWRESYDASAMTVWVEIDSIPASPASTNFFIHYGKASQADASNGTNTFAFFDGFLGSSLDTSKWTGDTGSASVSGSVMTLVGAEAWEKLYSSVSVSPPYALRAMAQIPLAYVSFGLSHASTTDMADQYGATIRCYKDGTGTSVGSNDDGNMNVWDIEWTTSSTAFLMNNVSMTNSPITTNIPTKALPIGLSAFKASGYDLLSDWVLLRKYTGTEPTWGSPGLETPSVDPVITSSPTTSGAVGYAYFYNATCTYLGAVGSVNWQLVTNASWLTQGLNGTGFQNISGTPNAVGVFYVNLTVNDSDSSDSQNYSITVIIDYWNDFLNAMSFTRSPSNPILSATETWEGFNMAYPTIVEESSYLTMYYGAFGWSGADAQIGLATSPKTYPPTTWTKEPTNPIFSSTGFAALGNVFKDNGTYYLYFQNRSLANTPGIAMATSTDGITFIGTPDVLTISGDEISIESPAVVRVDATHWYMYYGYRTAGVTLPGYRAATSPDGITWTKVGGNVLDIGTAGQWDDTYLEHHQILYIYGHYVLVYEAYGGSGAEPWQIGMAYSTSPTTGFTKFAGNPIFQPSGIGSAFDQYHVATPFLFLNNSIWYLFFQGGNNTNYGSATWALGLASSNPFASPAFTSSGPTDAWEDHAYSYQPTCDQPIDTWGLDTNASWLSQNGATGEVSGMPDNTNSMQSYYVNVTATNPNGTVYENYSVTVANYIPHFSTSAGTLTYYGATYSYIANFDDKSVGGSFTGITTNYTSSYTFNTGTGQLSFYARELGSFWFDIACSDNSGAPNQTGNQNFTVEIISMIFTSSPITGAWEDHAYVYSLIVNESVSSWALDTDATWLSQDPITGEIGGTPDNTNSMQVYYAHIQATSLSDGFVWQNFTITVANYIPYMTTTPDSWIYRGHTYTYTADFDDLAVGGTFTGIASNDPDSYTFNPATGDLSFYASTPGSYWFNITFSDNSGASNQTQNQNWTLDVLSILFTSTPITGAWEDHAYSYTPVCNESITTWGFATNATWLSQNPTTGEISGTPDNANSTYSYYAHITATNSNGISWQNYTVTVANRAPAFTSSPPTTGIVHVNISYNANTDDEGIGTPGGNYSGVTTNFPDPYTFNLTTGILNLTVLHGGVYWFNITADDQTGASNATSWQNFTVTVAIPPDWSFTSSGITGAWEDHNYSYTFTTNQTVISWSLTTNATWLHMNATTGEIYGLPTNLNANKFYSAHLMVSSANYTHWQNFSILVANNPPSFSTSPSVTIWIGLIYGYAPNTTDQGLGGHYSLIWDPALTIAFNVTSGLLAFNAQIAGAFAFNLTFDDGSGAGNATVSQIWYVTVKAPGGGGAVINVDFTYKVNGNVVVFTVTSDSFTSATVQYFWDFGDGTTSTLKDPTHVYEKVGIYTVTLTLGSQYAMVASAEHHVTISSLTPPGSSWWPTLDTTAQVFVFLMLIVSMAIAFATRHPLAVLVAVGLLVVAIIFVVVPFLSSF